MSLLSVEDALHRILSSARLLNSESIAIADAHGRTLAEPLHAKRTQPPFNASAMDGYAVRGEDVAKAGSVLTVIGESAAGHGFHGTVGSTEAVRIFTGAPVPEGADTILLQEHATREGDRVTVTEPEAKGRHIRSTGLDFAEGQSLIAKGHRFNARSLALAAAMNHGHVRVAKKPKVAILATGDELVLPGHGTGADQIVASNHLTIAALAEEAGADTVQLGIAGDTFLALERGILGAEAEGADILVTIGGASVGDHDLVQSALTRRGMELGFWRIAMRPGKPLIHGKLGAMAILGLPGNPVSATVCSLLFLVPLIRAMQGDPDAGNDRSEPARLGCAVRHNDKRQDYLRAALSYDADGFPIATPYELQDSSMISTLVNAGALVIRQPNAAAQEAGSLCRILRL
jgi:molybdopterin molybdotransferase